MSLSLLDRQIVQEMGAVAEKLSLADQDSQSSHVLSAAMAYIRSLAASALGSSPYDITWNQIASVFKGKHLDTLLLGRLHLDRATNCMGRPYSDNHDLAFGGMMESMVRIALPALYSPQLIDGAINQKSFKYLSLSVSWLSSPCGAIAAHILTIDSGLCAVLLQVAHRGLDIAGLLLQAHCKCCTEERLRLACRGYESLMIGAFQAGNIMEACRAKWVMERPEVRALSFMPADDLREDGYT